MKKFSKKIDMRSRKAMVDFLENHFRYYTMSRQNRETSYAQNLKVTRIGLTDEQEMKLLDLMSYCERCDSVNQLVDEFNYAHNFELMARFNGRRGGYLVLYSKRRNATAHKSFCTACGQRNYRSTAENGCRCGRCGKEARIDYDTPPMQLYARGKGIDMNEDFEDWAIDEIRERVKLVQEFDELCDRIVEEAAYVADHYEV